MNNFILEMYTYVLDGMGSGLMKLAQGSPSSIEGFEGVWTAVVGIYRNVALPIAVGLMVIYFLMALVQKQLELGDQMSLNSMLKPMMGFALGILILFNGVPSGQPHTSNNATVMISVYELGQGMTNDLVSYIGGDIEGQGALTPQEKVDIINLEVGKDNFARLGADGKAIEVNNKFGMMDSIGKLLKVLIPYMLALIGNLYGMFILYGRLFEVYIRFAVAPIALSDMFIKGSDSTGFRFIKDFAALAIQGFLIIIVFYVFGLIQSAGWAGGDTSGMFAKLAMFISQLALLGRTKDIAKSLVGIN